MVFSILADVLIIFFIALVVGMVFNRFKVPAVVAFILTGIIVGPYGLGIIQGQEQVESLAEIGIILLLFTIGLEFSFKNLWKIRLIAVLGGAIQIGLSFIFFCSVSLALGIPMAESIILGFLFALSSTAIVLKLLHQRDEIDSPHGSIVLGILIFQDLMAIPMMMAIPFLASLSMFDPTPLLSTESLVDLVIKDIILILVIIVSAKWVIPRLLNEIAKSRNQELFLIFVILVCFGVAWLVSIMGISLAIGALLAGLLISESEYSHQAVSIILPFRDIFTSFFFISVGMLVDVQFLIANIWIVVFLIIGVILVKALFATAAPLAIGYPLRTSVMAGLSLAQVGEFSFIIAQSAAVVGILTKDIYQMFLIVALITMAATPLVISIGNPLTGRLCRVRSLSRFVEGSCGTVEDDDVSRKLRDHMVIIGYGVTGKNLSKAALHGGIPFNIIELNPDLVNEARRQGAPVIFGDAIYDAVLEHAAIRNARIAVVAINDPIATRKIVSNCRHLNPGLTIVVRTRYVSEVESLHAAGADQVIAQEFETSIEIFTVVMNKFFIPQDRIGAFIEEVRADGYRMLRSTTVSQGTLPDLVNGIPNMTISALTVGQLSPLAGVTLGEFNLRKQYNLLVLAVRRGDTVLTSLSGETRLEAGDIAIVYATPENLAKNGWVFVRMDKIT